MENIYTLTLFVSIQLHFACYNKENPKHSNSKNSKKFWHKNVKMQIRNKYFWVIYNWEMSLFVSLIKVNFNNIESFLLNDTTKLRYNIKRLWQLSW